MITLKRLQVEALKQLRGIDLNIPRRGSVLIEGPNEAGKSTLFEAIYFALYGRALVGEESRPTLAALIPHDRSQARISLTLVAGDAELEVSRGLTRGRSGAITSDAALVVRRAGAPDERINAVTAVNERIEQELRGIDSETFRNSLFMEQKALERIEVLPRESRDHAISRLLGLERLTRAERLAAPPAELMERAESLRARLGVAERQRAASDAGAIASEISLRVRAAETLDAITRRDSARARLDDCSRREVALTHERDALRARLAGLDQLNALGRRLTAADTLRWSALNAQREAENLAARLADLGSAERLPEAQRRLAEISALEERLALALDHQRRMTNAIDAARRIQDGEATVAGARQATAGAERTLEEARQALARARLGESLDGWVRAHQALDLRVHGERRMSALRADHDAQAASAAKSRAAARRGLAMTAACGGVAALCALLALVTGIGLLWLLPPLALAAMVVVALPWRRQMTNARTQEWRVTELDRQMVGLAAEVNLTRRLGGENLDQYEASLRAAREPIPASADEARARIAALPPAGAIADIEAHARDAEAAAARARFGEERASAELEQARSELAVAGAQAGVPIDSAGPAPDQIETVERELAAIAAQAERLDVAPDLAGLAAARGAAEAAVNSLNAAAGDYTRVTALLNGERAHVVSARDEWVASLAEIGSGARAAGLETPPDPPSGASMAELDAYCEALAAALAAIINERDEPGQRARDGAIGAELDQIAATRAEAEAERARLIEEIRASLAEATVPAHGDEPLEEIASRWPPLATADVAELDALRAERERAEREAYHTSQSSDERAREASVEHITLDVAVLRDELASVEREIRQRDLAAQLAAATRARIIHRALPETEAYMRAILPALTMGRYRDVSLARNDAQAAHGDVDLGIRMWDQTAGRYVRKNLFSGGARDQASLALRLAFALATLPRGRGATPGFIFLDEPLSAFDAERSQALARALTHGAIADAFPQVFLISHSQVIDPRDFDYTLRMEAGRVVASNLPSNDIAEALWAAEEGARVATVEREGPALPLAEPAR